MTRRPPRSATIGRSALVGAARGVLLGLLFGLVSAIFFTTAGLFLGLVLFSVAIGQIFGVIGALECVRTGGSRSVTPAEAERHDEWQQAPKTLSDGWMTRFGSKRTFGRQS